jgi:hypothetical protein
MGKRKSPGGKCRGLVVKREMVLRATIRTEISICRFATLYPGGNSTVILKVSR